MLTRRRRKCAGTVGFGYPYARSGVVAGVPVEPDIPIRPSPSGLHRILACNPKPDFENRRERRAQKRSLRRFACDGLRTGDSWRIELRESGGAGGVHPQVLQARHATAPGRPARETRRLRDIPSREVTGDISSPRTRPRDPFLDVAVENGRDARFSPSLSTIARMIARMIAADIGKGIVGHARVSKGLDPDFASPVLVTGGRGRGLAQEGSFPEGVDFLDVARACARCGILWTDGRARCPDHPTPGGVLTPGVASPPSNGYHPRQWMAGSSSSRSRRSRSSRSVSCIG